VRDEALAKTLIKILAAGLAAAAVISISIFSWGASEQGLMRYISVMLIFSFLTLVIYKFRSSYDNLKEQKEDLQRENKKYQYKNKNYENKMQGFKKRIKDLKSDNIYQKNIINQIEMKLETKNKKIEELKNDIDVELNKARNVHRQMLPKNIPEPKDISISTYYEPAEYIGGDYYNVFKIDHGSMSSLFDQYLIYVFDVSGHGIDSTLLSIFINETIENYFKLKHNPGEMVSPAEIMEYIDREYQKEEFPADYIVSLFVGLLDANSYKLKYSSAGFQFPIYLTDKNRSVSEIDIGGLPLSAALGSSEQTRKEQELFIEKENTLLLSTDGLMEQKNSSSAFYSRIKNSLKKDKELPPHFLRDKLLNEFYEFNGDNAVKDDVTFIIIERQDVDIRVWESGIRDDDFASTLADIKEYIFEDYGENKASHKLLNVLKSYVNIDNFPSEKKSVDIRVFDNTDYIMFTLAEESGHFDWKILLEHDQELVNLRDDAEKFSQKNADENLYVSYSDFNNKAHLLLLK